MKAIDSNFENTVLSRAVHVHLEEGRIQRAQALVSAWRQRSPADAAPLALQSIIELMGGNAKKAQDSSQQALAMDRNSPQAYAAAAQVHMVGGRIDEALLCARRALNLDPTLADTAQLLAQLLLKSGNVKEARAVLQPTLIGEHLAARLMLAELQLRTEDGVEEADLICRQICESHPHKAAAWALHALARAMLGDFPRARQALQLALALEPDQPIYMLELARLYLEGGVPSAADIAEAAELARKVQTLDPQEWQAPLMLARALTRQRQFMPAMKTLSNAAQALPNQAELWIELARACAEVGQVQAAAQALDKAEALKTPATTLGPRRFELELRRGDVPKALASYEAMDAILRAGKSRMAPLSTAQTGHAGVAVGFLSPGVIQCLMFMRYMAPLAEAGVAVGLWAPAMLAPLLGRVKGVVEVMTEDGGLNTHHVESVIRAPLLLGMADSLPPSSPYLTADPLAVAGARMRRAAMRGPVMLLDLGVDFDAGLLHQLGQWLHSNKVNVVAAHALPGGWKDLGLSFHCVAEDDFEQMAAWSAVADFVVAADVPLSHLAGGMGRPAHTVLPLGHDAMWALEPSTSLWYPSLRLYRETLQGGWGEAWPRLKEALDEQLASLSGKAA